MKLQLSIGMAANPRTRPIFDGSVHAEAIDLVASAIDPSELFWRQLRFADFDVSEMSMSSLMMAVANGDDRWIGLPIFTTHFFFHTRILVRRDAGIDKPGDLKGKRVGVPEYQQTAALWSRGILQHEFGVGPKDMEFWMERPLSHSHLGAVGAQLPAGVTIHQIPPEKNIGTMMASGELDATLLYLSHSNLVDRSRVDLLNHPDVKRLFPDPAAEGARYFRKTGLFPINHGMVMKREIAEKHPWAVLNLYKAFVEANQLADEQRREHIEYHISTGSINSDAAAALHKPVLQHGIAANRAVLETAALYSHEQGLTPRPIKLEELFAASTMLQ
jgi:4,5-dihydroxyphthalate decarboxylase